MNEKEYTHLQDELNNYADKVCASVFLQCERNAIQRILTHVYDLGYDQGTKDTITGVEKWSK